MLQPERAADQAGRTPVTGVVHKLIAHCNKGGQGFGKQLQKWRFRMN